MSEDIERRLLEAIEHDADTTQANLAAQLGVAVGSVNWYLKRLIRKGYVKVTHLQRRKLKYFLTPQGLALKAELTSEYMKTSLRVYRRLRYEAQEALRAIQEAGFEVLQLSEDNEAAEILRLTCLEHSVKVLSRVAEGVPRVDVDGTGFVIHWPDETGEQFDTM